ncbi:MAG: hypothetical protein ABII20_06290, partial [Candidatus Omnitrophota bacterium]
MTLNIFIYGFTVMSGQVLILRSFFTVFYGNELFAGLVLASWLLLTSAGAFAGSRFRDRPLIYALGAQFVFAVSLPLVIILINYAKTAFGIPEGAAASPLLTLGVSFLLLAPCCFFAGAVFPLYCRAAEISVRPMPGRVYSLEAAGTALGGLVTSLFMIRVFSALEAAWIISFLVFLAAAVNIFIRGGKPAARIAAVFFLLLWLSAFIYNIPSRIERRLVEMRYAPRKVLFSADSIYGNITVTEYNEQRTFLTDGLYAFSVPDSLNAALAAYVPLLQRPAAQKMLFVGGGPEPAVFAADYPVGEIVCVEQDALLAETIARFARIPRREAVKIILDDPRVHIKNSAAPVGGLSAAPEADADAAEYDCVVVNAAVPASIRANSYYTRDFFAEVKRVLKPGGILVLGTGASGDYMNRALTMALSSVYKSLKDVFDEVAVLPGARAFFIASDESLSSDWRALLAESTASGAFRMLDSGIESDGDPARVKWFTGALEK